MPKQVNDNEVFLAVTKLLVERGYAGTTTKQIAREANVNEVTLFRKYGSKAELVTQAIAQYAIQEDIDALVMYTGDVETDLQRVVTQYFTFAERHGEFFPIIVSEMTRYPELQSVMDAPMELIAAVSGLIKRYQETGVLEEENPFLAVTALLGPLIVNSMVRKGKPDVPLPLPDLQTHVRCFLNGRSV